MSAIVRDMTDEPKDPFQEAAKSPAWARYAGAALFIVAAIIGISTIRACRGQESPGSPALPRPAQLAPGSTP